MRKTLYHYPHMNVVIVEEDGKLITQFISTNNETDRTSARRGSSNPSIDD